jgi:hypothetical protein
LDEWGSSVGDFIPRPFKPLDFIDQDIKWGLRLDFAICINRFISTSGYKDKRY